MFLFSVYRSLFSKYYNVVMLDFITIKAVKCDFKKVIKCYIDFIMIPLKSVYN